MISLDCMSFQCITKNCWELLRITLGITRDHLGLLGVTRVARDADVSTRRGARRPRILVGLYLDFTEILLGVYEDSLRKLRVPGSP